MTCIRFDIDQNYAQAVASFSLIAHQTEVDASLVVRRFNATLNAG